MFTEFKDLPRNNWCPWGSELKVFIMPISKNLTNFDIDFLRPLCPQEKFDDYEFYFHLSRVDDAIKIASGKEEIDIKNRVLQRTDFSAGDGFYLSPDIKTAEHHRKVDRSFAIVVFGLKKIS